jgi:hypothetical protein
MADWKSIAQLVAPFAPTVGRFLGDLVPFPGASIVGGLLGEAVAAALGVPATPEAVGTAIQTMHPSEVQAKLAAAESEAVARYDAMARIAEAEAADRTAQSQAVNETMRAEIGNITWYHWRHLLGYVVGFEILVFPLIAMTTILFGAADRVSAMMNFQGSLIGILGIGSGLLGVVAVNNTTRTTVALTGESAPSITSTIAKAVLPKKR